MTALSEFSSVLLHSTIATLGEALIATIILRRCSFMSTKRKRHTQKVIAHMLIKFDKLVNESLGMMLSQLEEDQLFDLARQSMRFTQRVKHHHMDKVTARQRAEAELEAVERQLNPVNGGDERGLVR